MKEWQQMPGVDTPVWNVTESALPVMPGATRQSFIERFLEEWPTETPALYDIIESLSGMNLWHRVIGSTGPEYLSEPGLAMRIYKLSQDRFWQRENEKSGTRRAIDERD